MARGCRAVDGCRAMRAGGLCICVGRGGFMARRRTQYKQKKATITAEFQNDRDLRHGASARTHPGRVSRAIFGDRRELQREARLIRTSDAGSTRCCSILDSFTNGIHFAAKLAAGRFD